MTNNQIPDWLCEEEAYTPPKGNVSFAESTKKSLMRLMSRLKNDSESKRAKQAKTGLRLFVVLVFIVLTALSKNFSFVLFMLAGVVVRIATLKAEKIKELLSVLLPIIILSFVVLLPSMFMGSPQTPLLVASKIFVCTGMALIVSLTSSMSDLTSALKGFYVPDIIIFTITITIKYIFILGKTCDEMLTALKIRSIGNGKDKKDSMAGIMGSLFVKTKKSGEETARAMECRGFNGKYVKKKREKLNALDVMSVLMLIAVAFVFVYLEVLI